MDEVRSTDPQPEPLKTVELELRDGNHSSKQFDVRLLDKVQMPLPS
ncbi:hypothetical protein [Streptomyces sp. NPDC002403]